MAGTRSTLCSNGCCFECEECSRKPGSPTLCADCLRRRSECAAEIKVASVVLGANSYQVGGSHYRRVEVEKGGQQHWDRMWDLYREAWFVGNITSYVERYRTKNGIEDLEKARHYLTKLLELEEAEAEMGILPPVTTSEVRKADTPLMHAVDGRETLCGITVGDMNCTVYRPYVNCPRCKEKFQ